MTSDPDSLEVLQRNYYYPFGMEMEGPWQAATAPRADYLYNGKELEEELKLNWYAYGFRYYDPSIGRFTGVDPLAEIFPDQSPYLYAYNAPVRMVDVDGLYGDEGEANKQRQAAVDQGLKVGDSYQSGDDWGFNVVNGENSYSAFKWDFAGENEAYAQLAERDFVPGLGNVEGNYGNQNTVEALGCFAHLSADVLEIVILTQGGGAKKPKGFNPALPEVAAKTSTRFVTTANGVVHDLKPTLERISSGVKFPHRNDGSIFKNIEGLLPKQNAGYYREFVHPTPGVKGPGAMRVVTGQGGEMWFTPDHYKTFIPIR
jgi:RHS repeat-associated protein